MDPATLWTVAAIIGLLLLSAFFSGSETALTAVSRAALHRLAGRGERGAASALKLTEDNERLIGAVLLGNNLVNILAASLATHLFTRHFGQAGVAWATLVMTFLVLVFAEVTPKTYAITSPETAALRVAKPISIFVRLFAPVVGVIRVLARGALRVVGVRADPDARILGAHEEIRGAIDLHHSEGGVEKDDRDRLLAALDLNEREVSEVMRHRRNIETIDADAAPDEIVAFFLNSSHTRIPVWRDEPENIVGVIHAKDLLREVDRLARAAAPGRAALDNFDVMAVAMEPWFVPDTTSLDEQMREFLRRRSHFALVVDEYGDLQGLITLEDILEEIVGDISDEHDPEEATLAKRSDGSIEVEGEMTIRDLNRFGDWDLPDDEATTVAGLVIHEAQTIPDAGQIFSFHGFRFEVLARERHRITKLRVKPLDPR
ncbi:HlyC/CorC family transporter [Pikeienuella piscinae]|uniref:HlyC/CorC family transporter n=1 Tax=Pikeienuella piscinae TaxID=2748098 RepID=A0A7L5BSF3_9RHOB|nr:HlyC/CorC family transporter [Pikeienuella piscinae]QIE54090.1 HlyC/CorC family transporter [Pikeienuella piscinae]